MNRGEQALKLAKLWSAKVGPRKVELYLVNHPEEFGSSTAHKVSRGKYESVPGYELAEAIFEGAALDDVTLPEVKSA